jgi:hypothetical protein
VRGEYAVIPMAMSTRWWDRRGILHPRLRPGTQSPVLCEDPGTVTIDVAVTTD